MSTKRNTFDEVATAVLTCIAILLGWKLLLIILI
jgi:hypothetical protein